MRTHLFILCILQLLYSSVSAAAIDANLTATGVYPTDGKSLQRRGDKPLFVGQTFTSGTYRLLIDAVGVGQKNSEWKLPSAEQDRAWLANQLATSVKQYGNSGQTETGRVDIAGGWTWDGTSFEGWPFNDPPYGLLYQIWNDAIMYGAEQGHNYVVFGVATITGEALWSYQLYPSNS